MSKIQKQTVQFNSCGYSVYPVGTPIVYRKEIQRISGVYITPKGEVLYAIGKLNKWFSSSYVELNVLFEVANSITIKS